MEKTVIIFMTEGMLVKEFTSDPTVPSYSVIVLDEVHERTIPMDMLLYFCKSALKVRTDLKIIITSATLNAQKYANYFKDEKLQVVPILQIPGRKFNVETIYYKVKSDDIDESNDPDKSNVTENDRYYVELATKAALEIHNDEEPGDILLFLPGKDEIDSACQYLTDIGDKSFIALPVYSALPKEEEEKFFDSTGEIRKIVIATNIAETSLTVPGIKFVIDPGFVKQKPESDSNSLDVCQISQASAIQRAGRAGRMDTGKCYRLYSEEEYNKMAPVSLPEIQRVNLAEFVLRMKAAGVSNFAEFLDPPSEEAIKKAYEQLKALGTLDNNQNITALGNIMTDFPLEPNLTMLLIKSAALECSNEALTIVAMMSAQFSFLYSKNHKEKISAAKRRFHHPDGDHFTLLNVFNEWAKGGYGRAWCRPNYINYSTLWLANSYRWWWRSFFIGGSSAFYVFAYSVFYYFTKLEIIGFIPTLLYFGYSFMIAFTFWLFTGTVGFYAAYYFVQNIYSAVKID